MYTVQRSKKMKIYSVFFRTPCIEPKGKPYDTAVDMNIIANVLKASQSNIIANLFSIIRIFILDLHGWLVHPLPTSGVVQPVDVVHVLFCRLPASADLLASGQKSCLTPIKCVYKSISSPDDDENENNNDDDNNESRTDTGNDQGSWKVWKKAD